MSNRSRAIADEAIRQAREACYGDANVGNRIEGDYGNWDDWRDMIEEVVERSCANLTKRLAAAEARVKELEQRGILNMDAVVNHFYEGS